MDCAPQPRSKWCAHRHPRHRPHLCHLPPVIVAIRLLPACRLDIERTASSHHRFTKILHRAFTDTSDILLCAVTDRSQFLPTAGTGGASGGDPGVGGEACGGTSSRRRGGDSAPSDEDPPGQRRSSGGWLLCALVRPPSTHPLSSHLAVFELTISKPAGHVSVRPALCVCHRSASVLRANGAYYVYTYCAASVL